MYNKPITQRVAFARSKKPSALKQTEDTTVLNEDIMARLKTTETIPGQETTEIVGGGKGTTKGLINRYGEAFVNPKVPGQTWAEFKDADCGSPGKPYGKGMCKDVEPPKEIITKGPDQVIEKEAPLYGFDRGDVDYTWQQRSRGRQALEGSRKSGKIARKGYESMSDADRASSLGLSLEEYNKKDIKNKRQFGKAKKEYEAAQASKSYDAYLQSQREASEQGISQGAKGQAKVTVPNRNKYVVELSKADIESAPTSQQRADFYQNKKNENDANTANAVQNAVNNQAAVDQRANQEEIANKDIDPALKMKAGPLKMKSSFKMGGFGNKTYKK